MTDPPLRVLCLDIEGGYGGSSRSLYETLRHLDAAHAAVEVWCRKDGPIQSRYRQIGIPVRVEPAMPRFSALPSMSRNLVASALFARDFLRARSFRRSLRQTLESRFDLVHFNHEGLFWLAHWLRSRVRIPFAMHIRTNILPSAFARFQVRTISRAIDHRLFITENEEANYRRLGGTGPGTVIYNPAPDRQSEAAPDPDLVARGAFRIACIANYSYSRGIDRLVDVAQALLAVGETRVHFIHAGHATLTRSVPGELGRVARAGGDLVRYVRDCEVADSFTFLGHVSDPGRVVASCQMLIKPTRMNDPWGRDVIEAMAAGKPVISFGAWNGYIRDGETGFLFARFSAEHVARRLRELADDPVRVERMGDLARAHIQQVCNGPARARDLLAVWQALAAPGAAVAAA